MLLLVFTETAVQIIVRNVFKGYKVETKLALFFEYQFSENYSLGQRKLFSSNVRI